MPQHQKRNFVVINKCAIGRGITLVVILIFTGILNSCGSGAVSAPDPATGTPLSVFPGAADVFPDVPTTFTVSGGTPAYTIFSSNSVALPVTSAVSGTTFTIVPAAVSADTAVDITVRDATNKSIVAKANIKPSTLINQVTFTPIAPTGTGCGTGICSGGDAQVVVRAALNGIVLKSRPIRFELYQGSFKIVTPGTGQLVNSLTINTDEQGDAVVRITATPGAPTQVATIQSTDVATGLSRRYNFNIIQQISGAGVLSTLPSGGVTLKGAKGGAGQDGFCPSGPFAVVDYYIFGGTPPYVVASPLPALASPIPSVVTSSGGRFTAQINGCGKVSFIVTDATGRTIETSAIDSQQGDKGDALPTTSNSLSVSPTSLTIACGSSASVSVVGSGTYTTTIATGGGAGFSVTPASGAIPNTVTLAAASGAISSPITVNFIAGTTLQPVTITVTGISAGSCP